MLPEGDGLQEVVSDKGYHSNQSLGKQLLIHAGGFNLGLLMAQLIGVGTRRGHWRSLVSFAVVSFFT